jgi:hypothetical protein
MSEPQTKPDAAPSFVDTPEFKSAVGAAVTDALAQITAKMAQNAPAAVSGSSGSELMDLFQQMALSIAEVSDQGTNRKRVAPEVLLRRENAKNAMGDLLMAARDLPKAERPRYRLVAKVYFGERLVDPFQRLPDKRVVPTEVYWLNAPNDAMRPVNKSAKAIYEQYLIWVGGNAATVGGHQVPAWVSPKGVVIAAPPPATAQQHGLTIEAEPLEMDDGTPVPMGGGRAVPEDDDFGIINQNDPRAPEVSILGTIAPKAKQTALGDFPKV